MTFPTASVSPSCNCILAVYVLKKKKKEFIAQKTFSVGKKREGEKQITFLCNAVTLKTEDTFTERKNMLIKTGRGQILIHALFV